MKSINLNQAAAAMGRKGGLKRGPSKARNPIAMRKAQKASVAARKRNKLIKALAEKKTKLPSPSTTCDDSKK